MHAGCFFELIRLFGDVLRAKTIQAKGRGTLVFLFRLAVI